MKMKSLPVHKAECDFATSGRYSAGCAGCLALARQFSAREENARRHATRLIDSLEEHASDAEKDGDTEWAADLRLLSRSILKAPSTNGVFTLSLDLAEVAR